MISTKTKDSIIPPLYDCTRELVLWVDYRPLRFVSIYSDQPNFEKINIDIDTSLDVRSKGITVTPHNGTRGVLNSPWELRTTNHEPPRDRSSRKHLDLEALALTGWSRCWASWTGNGLLIGRVSFEGCIRGRSIATAYASGEGRGGAGRSSWAH